jgi:integrase
MVELRTLWDEVGRSGLHEVLARAAADSVPRGAKFPRKTMAEAIAAIRDAKAGKSRRHAQSIKSNLYSLAKACPPALHEVTPEIVQRWVLAGGRSPASQARRYRYARLFFAYCVRRGWLDRSPVDAVECPTMPAKTPAVWTAAESARMLAAIAPAHRPALALLLFAGVRPESEGPAVRWEDWNGAWLTVRSGKTGRVRRVPVRPALAAFWAERGTGPVMLPGFRKARLAASAATGVKWSPDVTRHTCASMWLADTQDAARTAWAMGHAEAVLRRHYDAAVSAEEAATFWAIRPESIRSASACGDRRD